MQNRFSSAVVRGVLLTAGLMACPVVAQTHPMQPADLVDLKTVERPRISPDGTLAVYPVRTPVPSGKPANEHLWIVRTDGSSPARPLVFSSGVDTAPAFSPDGRHVAFLSNRPSPLATPGSPFRFTVAADTNRPDIPNGLKETAAAAKPDADTKKKEKTADIRPQEPAPPIAPEEAVGEQTDMQLWWIALDGGEAEPLTSFPGGIRSFEWSNDGTRIAIIRTDSDSKAERDRKKIKNDREIMDAEYRWDRLWLLDLAAHQARLLTPQDANIDTVNWAPDDRTVVSRVSATPRLDDYWRTSKVEIFDTATGALRFIVEERSGYLEPMYSKDGARIVYSRFTERSITDVHLVRTLATGKDVRLEDKLQGTLAQTQWLADGHLLVNAYVGAHTEAHEIDPVTLAGTPVPDLPPTTLDFDSSRDGKTFAFLGETPSQPAEVQVWKSNKAARLTDTNPQVAQWSLGEVREVQWKNPRDGHTVYGVLLLPPGYKPGKRYKAAIHMHGGPEEAFTVGFSANWYNYGELLASQGYVVLQPNYRGSAGQEIAFTEGDADDLGGKDFADVMAGTDWLVAQGFADPQRIVIAGWSYGGYLTAWAVTHTDRFKAAMAGAPVIDEASMATTTDIMSYMRDYLGPLTNHEADYDRHSPVRFAEACHTPVLVLHGQADVRVPTSQGMEFYRALRLLGREAQMITYPREPHIFHEREHQIDSLTHELQWFDQHLPPASGTP